MPNETARLKIITAADGSARWAGRLKQAEYGEKGSVRAVFCTMGAIDHDGDMILPGAIGDQQVRMSAYGHGSWRGELPVGKGRIFEQGSDAVFEGQFFLSTTPGRDTYETVKAMGDLQEWSFALPEIESETRKTPEGQSYRAIKRVTVPEVSPVLLGAGVNTRTLDVKDQINGGGIRMLHSSITIGELKTAIGSHSTGTDDAAWDAGANEKRVLADKPASYYAKAYAWRDPDGEVGVKSTYKFIHHFVSAEGEPGKASTRACSAGIAILNGGRGGTKIPDADRKGVYAHLARHLKDADKEPPELRAEAGPGEIKLIDQVLCVHADVQDLAERIAVVASMREGKGSQLGAATREQALLLAEALRGVVGAIEESDREEGELLREFVRFQQHITGRVSL